MKTKSNKNRINRNIPKVDKTLFGSIYIFLIVNCEYKVVPNDILHRNQCHCGIESLFVHKIDRCSAPETGKTDPFIPLRMNEIQ